jgi:hypothetical protein
MAAERHHRRQTTRNQCDRRDTGRNAPTRLYFVGRRPVGGPELYAVTATGVERLCSHQHFGTPELDWHAPNRRAALELAHEFLTRLVVQTPSEQLAARLAEDVVCELPYKGFVLSSEAIWLWIYRTSGPEDWSPTTAPLRRSWRDWLRSLVRMTSEGFALSADTMWLWGSCGAELDDWLADDWPFS